jgi:penicillin-binding protein 2
MGYDLPTGKRGNIPDVQTHKILTEDGDLPIIISNSIGQGEVLMTPIQLASMMQQLLMKVITTHPQKN